MGKNCSNCGFWYKNPSTTNDIGKCVWRVGMPKWFNTKGEQIAGWSTNCDAWEKMVTSDE